MEDYINLQKSTRIYGVIKQGCNKKDANAVKTYQRMGYDEHWMQSELGVHFTVIRKFMELYAKEDEKNGNKNVPVFEPTDPKPNADTKFLYDKIAQLEADAAKPTVEAIKVEPEVKEPKVKPKKKTKAA